jgi:hypothetical protein
VGPGKVFALASAVLAKFGINVGSSSETTTAVSGTLLAPDAVILGAATTSGVRLELATGTMDVREGDDSGYAPIRAQTIGARDGATLSAQLNAIGGGVLTLASGGNISWSTTAAVTGTNDTGLARSAAGWIKATNGGTGYGSIYASYPRRVFGAHKTPGTGATLTAVGGTPTHTLSGTASNVSDSTGHYVQLSADTATAGIDIATTEVTKTENGPIVTFVIKTGAVLPIATERLWVGMASASLAAADSPTGAHVMAFRYAPTVDATAFWRVVTNDGGADTGTETTTTSAIAVSTRYVLMIDATNSASIAFYVNGTLVATHTTNLPTATQALGTACHVNDVAAGSTKELLISNIRFETN